MMMNLFVSGFSTVGVMFVPVVAQRYTCYIQLYVYTYPGDLFLLIFTYQYVSTPESHAGHGVWLVSVWRVRITLVLLRFPYHLILIRYFFSDVISCVPSVRTASGYFIPRICRTAAMCTPRC